MLLLLLSLMFAIDATKSEPNCDDVLDRFTGRRFAPVESGIDSVDELFVAVRSGPNSSDSGSNYYDRERTMRNLIVPFARKDLPSAAVFE